MITKLSPKRTRRNKLLAKKEYEKFGTWSNPAFSLPLLMHDSDRGEKLLFFVRIKRRLDMYPDLKPSLECLEAPDFAITPKLCSQKYGSDTNFSGGWYRHVEYCYEINVDKITLWRTLESGFFKNNIAKTFGSLHFVLYLTPQQYKGTLPRFPVHTLEVPFTTQRFDKKMNELFGSNSQPKAR